MTRRMRRAGAAGQAPVKLGRTFAC